MVAVGWLFTCCGTLLASGFALVVVVGCGAWWDRRLWGGGPVGTDAA